MSLVDWLRGVRHPLALLLLATVVPVILLGGLGWRLLREEQALEGRRLQARLEASAEALAAALDRDLVGLEERLGLLAAGGSGPARAAASRLAEEVFAAGEAIELRRNDPVGAARVFADLARSPDPDTRAGALVRLARSLRKAGQPERALASYAEMRQLGTATIRGTPADLVARQARCRLLGEMGRVPEMREEARSLYSDLQNGRWRLTREVYRFHSENGSRLHLDDERQRRRRTRRWVQCRKFSSAHTSCRSFPAVKTM
jgi:hypothetical protein